MALKKRIADRKTLQLISLFDVVFLLILFFLVTRVISVIGVDINEVAVRVPENEEGEAQICIQVTTPRDNGNVGFYWIDSDSVRTTIERTRRALGLTADDTTDRGTIRLALANLPLLDKSMIKEKISILKNRLLRNLRENYFVVIRCPGENSYSDLIEIIDALKGRGSANVPNLQYGCIEGSFDQILNAQRMEYRRVDVGRGRQQNVLRIAFRQ